MMARVFVRAFVRCNVCRICAAIFQVAFAMIIGNLVQSMDADAPNMELFRQALPRYKLCYEQLDIVRYVIDAAKELGLEIPLDDDDSGGIPSEGVPPAAAAATPAAAEPRKLLLMVQAGEYIQTSKMMRCEVSTLDALIAELIEKMGASCTAGSVNLSVIEPGRTEAKVVGSLDEVPAKAKVTLCKA